MICNTCSNDFPEEMFEIANTINGKKYRRRECNVCQSLDKKNRRSKTREWFISYKKSLKCFRCGNSDYRVLQFHHINGNKDSNVSNMVQGGCSRDTIILEISKCIVLCANCHSIEHYKE